jgi:hypothetical protein
MDEQNRDALNSLAKNPELLNELDKVSPGLKNQVLGYALSKWLPDGLTPQGSYDPVSSAWSLRADFWLSLASPLPHPCSYLFT